MMDMVEDIGPVPAGGPSGFFNPGLGGGEAVGAFGGGSGMAGPFEMDGRDIKHNMLLFGRTTVQCADAANVVPEQPSGWIVAEITHGSSSAGLSLAVVHANALPENTLDMTYVPLYKEDDGAWVDVRWMPTVCGLE